MRRIGLPMWFFGLLAVQTGVPAPSLHLIEWFSAFCVVDPTRSFMLRYPYLLIIPRPCLYLRTAMQACQCMSRPTVKEPVL